LIFTASLLDVKRDSVKIKPASLLVVSLDKAITKQRTRQSKTSLGQNPRTKDTSLPLPLSS